MRRGICVSMIAAVLLLSAAPAQATFPGKNGKIAVVVTVNVGHLPGDPDVYTVNPDGSDLIALTSDHRSSGPAWSPTGSKIAFHSSRDGDYDIYTMNADGSGVVQLTNDPG
jgi:parvulin-like peptidyl-prolyl isomerase